MTAASRSACDKASPVSLDVDVDFRIARNSGDRRVSLLWGAQRKCSVGAFTGTCERRIWSLNCLHAEGLQGGSRRGEYAG